jgi:arylsulfatase A-like enzyme/Flp pilus assembly protein TadD
VPKRSVLLITIDTLRADRVGGELTPQLNALARRGTTFTTMRATVPLTLPSHATILTGMLPPEHGVRQNGVVRDASASTTLARVFKENGYQTAAFVGAYVLDRRFGLAEGFDTYDDRVPRNPEGPARLESERRADQVVAAARAWLDRAERGKPLFIWVHLYDPHAPYEPPAEYLQRTGGKAYEGEVMFADAQAGAIEQAVRTAAGDALIVAVAGDHGEGLGEHGETTHGMLAYDSTLRVPFILSGPSIRQGTHIPSPASLRDLAPTLLAAAGLNAPSKITGRDLLGNQATASDVYAETTYPDSAGWSPLRALVDDRWKLIASSSPELYDVARDPGERQDVAAANPRVASAMAARADQIFGNPARAGTGHVSGEAAERLRSLGYVAPTPSSTKARITGPNPRDRIAEWNSFEQALSLISAGRSAEALAPLRQLASKDPDARVFQATYAQALKNIGRPREALAIYRKLVARWPEDATLFHDLAVAARELGYEQEAIKAERAALAVDPSDANAQNGLGLLHADAGRSSEAAAAFDKATELDPNNASVWTNLGNARRALGDLAAAERCYRRALDLNAGYADAANGLGVILVQQRRAPEAVPFFERAIASDPRLYEAQLNLGIAYQESGDARRAAEQYRKVMTAAPGGSREKQAARELLGGLR